MLPPRPPFDTATMRRKTKNEGEQKNGADAAAANPTVSTAAEAALPVRANPVIKKRDSFEVSLGNFGAQFECWAYSELGIAA